MNGEHKLPRGVSARPPGHQRPLQLLEILTIIHVGVLVVFASWAFGGNSPGAGLLLSWWGSLGLAITLGVVNTRETLPPGGLRPLRWLWPLALLNLVVLASTLNPSFRELADGIRTAFVEGRSHGAWPSSARPDVSLRSLWFFDAVYLSCFNLVLVVRQRRALRLLLLALAGNAVLLAVFGTLQKLVGSGGLYFGAVKSPQVQFFSTFIYHNHWAAFILLMTAATLGFVFHFARRSGHRDIWHSPVLAGVVAVALLAASIPLSASRSGTVLVIVLLTTAIGHWLYRLFRRRRAFNESGLLPAAGALFAVAVAGVFTYQLAQPVIAVRLSNTRDQIAALRASDGPSSRRILYRDTWNMAAEKPWFGWGMGSYPTVFFSRNTQHHSPVDGLAMNFQDAHSDWLQSAAELGLIGTALLGLCGLVPLLACRRTAARSALSAYLLAGCGLLLLYAWVEFPFGNRAVVAAFWLCFFCALHYGRLDSAAESGG